MINFSVVKAIYDKDRKEIFTLRSVKYSFILFPAFFLAMVMIILFLVSINENVLVHTVGNQPVSLGTIAMDFLIYLTIIPLALSAMAASYSFVGEKVQRTIEPILASPVTERELFFGKLLAPLIPAAIVSYIVLGIYTIFVDLLSLRDGYLIFPNLSWIFIVLIFTPSILVLSIVLVLIASSRVVDPRSAQQYSAIIVVPILAIFFVATILVQYLETILFIFSVLTAISAYFIYRLAVKSFDRERIITRWS